MEKKRSIRTNRILVLENFEKNVLIKFGKKMLKGCDLKKIEHTSNIYSTRALSWQAIKSSKSAIAGQDLD